MVVKLSKQLAALALLMAPAWTQTAQAQQAPGTLDRLDRLDAPAAMAAPAPRQEPGKSVFRLDVNQRGETEERGVATLVAEGTLITSASLIAEGNQWLVSIPADGLAASSKVVAESIAIDEVNDLALLRIAGLEGQPVPLALEEAKKDRKVSLILPEAAVKDGTVVSIEESQDKPTWVNHNIPLEAADHGAPLVNNCGELLGVTRSERRSFGRRLLRRPASEFAKVGDLATVRNFLVNNGIDYRRASAVCLSEEAQLKQERAQRELAQQLLEEEARRREQELAAKQNELAAIADERDTARQAEGQTRAELEKRDREAAEEREAQRRRDFYWNLLFILGGLALAGLVGATAYLVIRRRQQEQVEKAQAAYPDLLLSGTDADGNEHRLKISGTALVKAEPGLMIGRSAQEADYILNLDYISRRHCMLLVKGNVVLVKDLGSANGTAVNGRDLAAEQEAPLGNGDELRLGLLTMSVVRGA